MKMAKLKILFIGGTPRGLKLLTRLVQRKEDVVFAFIMPEDEHEPLQVSREIKQLCAQAGIPFSLSRKVEAADIPRVLKLNPDVAFVCGWRTLIPAEFYRAIPLGCWAAHDSLLPKYRGFAPTAWAIINGEKKTGVTLFKIDEGEADSGDIFKQAPIAIAAQATSSDIYPKIIKASVRLYEELLDSLKRGTLKVKKQNHKKATYAKRRRPDDGRVDWNKSSQEVFNFIRALQPPYPYSWAMLGNEKLFIKRAKVLGKIRYEPAVSAGTIGAVGKNAFSVKCAVGTIQLLEVVDSSGRAYTFNKFNKGQTLL
jgi:methionyl-tRNA formyltransferase